MNPAKRFEARPQLKIVSFDEEPAVRTSKSATPAGALDAQATASRDTTLRPETRLSAGMSLCEFACIWFVPVYLDKRESDDKTIGLYLDSIEWWRRLTNDPPLASITDDDLADFVRLLSAQKGRKHKTLSPYTIRRHVTNLQAILLRAGPRAKGLRHCQALLGEVPLFVVPSLPSHSAEGDFTMDEFSAMLAATAKMRRPIVGWCSPPTWWRAFLTLSYFTLSRVDALMKAAFNDVDSGGHWLRIIDDNAKGDRGYEVYLPAEARACVDAIRSPRNRILEWAGYPDSRKNLYDHFCRLQIKAGIAEAETRGFHGLRKLGASQLATIDRLAADIQLGHAGKSMMERHYIVARHYLPDKVEKMPLVDGLKWTV